MDRFERLLREKIVDMASMTSQVMTMSGYDTIEEYKYNLGYLRALNAVLAEMAVISEDMRK